MAMRGSVALRRRFPRLTHESFYLFVLIVLISVLPPAALERVARLACLPRPGAASTNHDVAIDDYVISRFTLSSISIDHG